MARCLGPGSDRAGRRPHRKEAAGTRQSRTYPQHHHRRSDDHLRRSAAGNECAGCEAHLVACAQPDRRYNARVSPGRGRSVLRRPVRGCLRQYLCPHRRRAQSSGIARFRRGRANADPQDSGRRQGRHRRCAGRGDLPRILHPQDRRPRHRPRRHHRHAAGAERRHPVRVCPDGAGTRCFAGRRALHLRRHLARDQS